MIVNKFDPNPILVNINKLKPYRFQDTITSKGLESIVKNERDTTNTEIGFHIVTLENAQDTCTKFSFSMDGTKIQESRLGIENQDLVVGTEIQNKTTRIENGEDPIGTKISTIGLKLKIHVPEPKSEIQSKQLKFRS